MRQVLINEGCKERPNAQALGAYNASVARSGSAGGGSFDAVKTKLKDYGYHINNPSGGEIAVMGTGKGYFKAKKAKADSILSDLKSRGFKARAVKSGDGYYDFWVTE